MMASEIGTSMLSARLLSAPSALVKNGRPENAAAGSAMSADSQWNMSRVSGVMSEALPAHTDTDKSITFIAAKPATARQRSRNFACSASRDSASASSKGWAT